MKISTGTIRRSTLWVMIIVMPIGIRIDGENDGELTIEGHGGTGQVYSILRDCSGNPVASQENEYSDYAGAIQYSIRSGNENFIVLGVRGGRLYSEYRPASRGPSQVNPRDYEFSYMNPYLALEGPYAGVGIGYLAGAPGLHFGERETATPLSAHLRLGSYAAVHFLTTFNENLPLASGGGYFTMGIGYPVGSRANFFTGASGFPYDRGGLVQKVSVRLSDRFDLDLNGRVGWTAGNLENGFSFGLRYHLPLGKKSGPNLFLEKRKREKNREEDRGNREIG